MRWVRIDRARKLPSTLILRALGFGTDAEIIELLGLNNHKAVILSVAREDMVPAFMNTLEDKFRTVRNGRGIAFAVPLSSVIGVNLYQFLSNNRLKRGE